MGGFGWSIKMLVRILKLYFMKNYLFFAKLLMVLCFVITIGCIKLYEEGEDNFPSESLTIGSSYQGGKILYLDKNGKNGLIAAPQDENGRYTWSSAFTVCDRKVLNGYDDWYLPNENELLMLYKNGNAMGGFMSGSDIWPYWSSDECSNTLASCFDSDLEFSCYNKGNNYRVRCLRAF